MGRHSAPFDEAYPGEQDIGANALPLGAAALSMQGEESPFDNERDSSGTVAQFRRLLDPEAVAHTRSYYQYHASQLPKDIQDFTNEQFVTQRRANHMTAHPRAHVIDIRERCAAQFVDTLEQRAPRVHSQHFINRDALLAKAVDTSEALMIETGGKSLITLPVRNFVYAEGFRSWREGRGETTPKVNEHGARVNSAELLKNYASRTTQAPPIEKVIGFVQPNGVILYTAREGSHRTGAAVMRGEQTIQVRTLSLMMLSDNVIGLDETEAASSQAA